MINNASEWDHIFNWMIFAVIVICLFLAILVTVAIINDATGGILMMDNAHNYYHMY